MRPALIALLLASMTAVQAGVFRRQCYPDTVYLTATANPATKTVTETEIIIATETLTVRPRPITVTAVVTEFATIHDPAGAATQTLQGSSSSSSTFAAATTKTLPSVTSCVSCSDSLDRSSSLQYGSRSSDPTLSASAMATVHIVSTVTVVPLATLAPFYPSADQTFSSDPPSYAAGIMTPTSPAAGNVSTITIARTETVFMTQTVMLTGLNNSSTTTGLFPTMNVTGTMGFKPSSLGGSASGSAASASVSAGAVGTTGTATTMFTSGPTSTTFSFGTNTTGSTNLTRSTSVTAITGMFNGSTTAQPATNNTASAGTLGSVASGSATNTLSTSSRPGLSASNSSLGMTSGAQGTVTSSFQPSITPQISGSGQLNGTLKRTEFGTGASTVSASTTGFSRNESDSISASRLTVTSAPSPLLPGTTTSQSLGPFANSSTSQTVALPASDPTAIQPQSFLTNSTLILGSSNQISATVSQSLSTSANVTASSMPSPFAEMTTTQFSSGAPLPTSALSLSETTNATEIQTSSTVANLTAPPNRRCLQEDPFAWRTDDGRKEMDRTAKSPDGNTITQTWNLAQRKRQVGQFITVTIDGQVVSWANNWDGTGTVDLATFSGIPTQPSLPSMEGSSAATPTQLPVTSSSAAAPAVTSLKSVASETQVSPTDPQISPSSRQSWTSSTRTTSPSVESFMSNHGLSAVLPISETSQTSSSFSQAAPTFGANPTALTPSVLASLSSSTSPATPQSAPTDVFITYTPPSWLSRLFPPEPTAPPSTAVVASIASFPNSVPSLITSTLVEASSSWSVSTSTACNGNFVGDFVVNFDDLPVVGEPSTNDQFAPLINPYHKLFWSQGYSYVPPPSDPYLPHSGSQLGVFLVNGDANVHSQNWTGPIPQGSDVNGMFGAGKNYQNPYWYIDAKGAWIGCQNAGPGDCDIQVNGFAYDDGIGKSVVQVIQHFYQSPCPSLSNCSLDYFEFSKAFRNLTAVQVQASVQDDPKHTAIDWFIDDIALAWSDNSCAAVEARDSTPST